MDVLKRLLLACIMIVATAIAGEGGAWTTLLSTSANDVASGVAVDSSGNSYVTGWTEGAISGATNAGYADMFLAKYDIGGTWTWATQLGSSGYDYPRGVAVDGSGNTYITGYTSGGLDSQTNSGGYDIFLVKYDSGGVKQWTTLLGTSNSDIGLAVAVDSTATYLYVAGYASGQLPNYVYNATSTGGLDIFVAKFNAATGANQWTTLLGATINGYSASDIANAIAVDTAGNAYVAGYSEGDLDGDTNAGVKDMFVAKFNSSGAKQWSTMVGTAYVDVGKSVAVDSSGTYVYVTGYTYGDLGGASNTSANGVHADLFVASFDTSDGSTNWVKLTGSTEDDSGMGAAVDSGGNVVTTGYTAGNMDGNYTAGQNDVFINKYNSSGTKLWTEQFGTSSADVAMGMALDSSGYVYVAGYTQGSLDGDTNAGNNDAFVTNFKSSPAVSTYYINVTKNGSGQVISGTGGISCGSTCAYNFSYASSVALYATASSGYTFTGWSGACTGTGSCVVSMLGDMNVTATFTASASSSRRVAYDFDGDGKSDILWRNSTNGQNTIWLINGATVKSATSIPAVLDLNYAAAAVADFSGDGMVDILWRNKSTGENAMWVMNGVSLTSAPFLQSVADTGYTAAAIGDFNGDSRADILWRKGSTGVNIIWWMNGATITSTSTMSQIAGSSIMPVGTGDFDADGKSDILWRNSGTGEVFVWLMNGDLFAGTMSSQVSVKTISNLNWQVAGVGDFDGNGKADILWRNASTGANIIYFMNGGTVSSWSILPTVSNTTEKIVAVADYNGDGKSDIVFRNASTGANNIWFMSGSGIQAAYTITSASVTLHAYGGSY